LPAILRSKYSSTDMPNALTLMATGKPAAKLVRLRK
jgi:hypothetical protein